MTRTLGLPGNWFALNAAIMALIGHDLVAMSHYTHVGRDALEKAANAFSEISI